MWVLLTDIDQQQQQVYSVLESIFLSRVEGRGLQVEGEGSMSRVEGNIFFSNFFFSEKVIIDALKK